MASIGSKNTKPEMLLRRALHARGFRYRLHAKDLPGKPDMVFPRHRAALFVNGCFWHGHDCELFRLPATRTDFWRKKIEGNRARDDAVLALMRNMGWRVITAWECAMRGTRKRSVDRIADEIAAWLPSSAPDGELRGGSCACHEPV